MSSLDHQGAVVLNRCVIRNNAQGAFAFGYRTGGVEMANSLVANNGTSGEPAVSLGIGSQAVLRHSTIVGGSGPAIHCSSAQGYEPTRVKAHNSILWAGYDGGDQITFYSQGGTGSFVVDVRFCIVQNGFAGEGNLNSDPLFADPSAGDFHLSTGSPGIDSGNAFLVPVALAADLEGEPRIADDPAAANTGAPFPTFADRGAYETPGTPYCTGDLDDDHDVDLADLALLLSQFGSVGEGLAGDGSRDGVVDLADLAILLSNFAAVCP